MTPQQSRVPHPSTASSSKGGVSFAEANDRTPPPATIPIIVAGIMSGTSADGVDIALARIRQSGDGPEIKLLSHHAYPYPRALRSKVLEAMDAQSTFVANLSQLHWRLGAHYADCLADTITASKQEPRLIGLHGQTIYHQPAAKPYAGQPTRTTWQLGEPSVLRERLGLPVISDFRPADLAAGGQGAPLVPILDFHLFRHPKRQRVLLNLGGIANITVIPPNATLAGLTAFDTGPANMVLDALTQRLYNKPYDRNGAFAARGTVLPTLLRKLLANPYFQADPPKSCGREQFGRPYAERLLKLAPNAAPQDLLATATELTAQTIANAIRPCTGTPTEIIAAGGGVQNAYLMSRLKALLSEATTLTTTATHNIPPQAKEALAFALLAWLTWHQLPGNVPAATGSAHPAILGKITL